MIKIKYLNLLVISQHYRVTIKEFIVIIFVSHTSPKTHNFWHKLRSAKARPHSVKTSLTHSPIPVAYPGDAPVSINIKKYTE